MERRKVFRESNLFDSIVATLRYRARRGHLKMVVKTFVMKMAQAEAIIWP
jgi:hypothetical protein